jgi:hypothetical protein
MLSNGLGAQAMMQEWRGGTNRVRNQRQQLRNAINRCLGKTGRPSAHVKQITTDNLRCKYT